MNGWRMLQPAGRTSITEHVCRWKESAVTVSLAQLMKLTPVLVVKIGLTT